jgi:hypothetical protein
MAGNQRKKRKDIGQKRSKYVYKKDMDWVSIRMYCMKMGIQNDLSIEEVRVFMSQECYCCGGASYGILPLSGKILNHTNAVVLCSRCYRPVQMMGVEKFVLHSKKVSVYGTNFVNNSTLLKIHNPETQN